MGCWVRFRMKLVPIFSSRAHCIRNRDVSEVEISRAAETEKFED